MNNSPPVQDLITAVSSAVIIILDFIYYDNNYQQEVTTIDFLEDKREAVDKVLEGSSFPHDLHVGYGDLRFISDEYEDAPEAPSYALVTNDLVLDAFYDIRELGVFTCELTVRWNTLGQKTASGRLCRGDGFPL